MAETSTIEWTDATWNPITGCSVVSPGCTNCYAMKLAGTRLQNHPSRKGLTRPSKAGPVWTGEVRLNAEWLDQPLRWKRPRRIFVCAHGDLLHESVPDEWIEGIFGIMAAAPHHNFQVLTKRADRMRRFMQNATLDRCQAELCTGTRWPASDLLLKRTLYLNGPWPLPNVWLGVSAEDQKRAYERIPHLLATPAAERFVSLEPLLGPINLTDIDYNIFLDSIARKPRENPNDPDWPAMRYDTLRGHMKGPDDVGLPKLDWVIAGGESGPGARPMHPDWVRSLRDQCAAAGVPFFFKQWGAWGPDAGPGRNGDDPIMDARAPCAVWHGTHWKIAPNGYTPATDAGDGEWVYRVGKKAAGAMLDGREWREMPR